MPVDEGGRLKDVNRPEICASRKYKVNRECYGVSLDGFIYILIHFWFKATIREMHPSFSSLVDHSLDKRPRFLVVKNGHHLTLKPNYLCYRLIIILYRHHQLMFTLTKVVKFLPASRKQRYGTKSGVHTRLAQGREKCI